MSIEVTLNVVGATSFLVMLLRVLLVFPLRAYNVYGFVDVRRLGLYTKVIFPFVSL